jgi:HEAT repeat protein
MIWSLFQKRKEAHILINELNSDNSEVSKAAYRELLDNTGEDCDSLLLDALNSRDVSKETKLAIISILGHRGTEEALPLFQKLLKKDDQEIKKGVIDALYEIGTSECIDILVKLLDKENDSLKQIINNHLSRLPNNETLGALLRCVPEDKNSQLYFEIVSLMEELDFFDILKSNFSQSDPLIKDFYFSSLIKFNRPDFIPLYLGYFPNAPISNKEKMVELLNEFQFKELIKYTEIYITKYGTDGLTNLIDQIIISRQKESILDTLKFVISLDDSKYKIKVLPNLLKHIDPYCYDCIFGLLKDSSNELRELATNCLIDLIKKTNKRLKDNNELNRASLYNLVKIWEKQIVMVMQAKDDIPEEYFKAARRVFFEICNYNHELLQPFFQDLVNKDFFETYYLLKDWSFEDKYDLYSWLIKTEPSFGSILLGSLTARADETLWRLAIKLSNAFNDAEDSDIYRKNLVTRYHNISIEKFLRDSDSGVRAAAIEICAQMKLAGYVDILRNYAKDPSPEVRKAAIRSLINDHSINSDQIALESLEDPNEEIVFYILQSLKSKIDPNRLYSYLIRYINSENTELRNYAKQEIATITKERYKINYNNMKPEVRKLAAQAIQKIDTNFADEVISDLRSYDPQTRLKAALLLESIQVDEKGQQALIAAMKDSYKKVRAAIVKTLGMVG